MVGKINFQYYSHPAIILRLALMTFLAGVALASFFRIIVPWYMPLALAILALIASVRWVSATTVFLLILAFIFGINRYESARPTITPAHVAYYNGTNASFIGVVSAEPDRRTDHTKLTVAVERLNGQPVFGLILVNTNSFPAYQYGDALEVTCSIAAPQPIETFAYDRYLAKEGIYSICRFARLTVVGRHQGNEFWTALYRLKFFLQEKINNNLSEPQASLFSAMTLGARQGLPDDLNEAFSVTGTTHLIAISGLNMVIVVAMLMHLALALGWWRQHAFWGVSAGLVSYLMLIGFPASAVRAAVMAWLALLVINLGRLNNASAAVLFAASGMVAFNPLILRDDAGFQLSVAAVLGLIYFGPVFDRFIGQRRIGGLLYEGIKTTLAAQLATMPFIIWYFGRLSLIAPLANLISVPIASLITLQGFVALIISLIPWPLASVGFLFSDLLLRALIGVVNFFASLPYAAVSL